MITHTPLRLLIADDHAIFRLGLCQLIEDTPGLEVVAECATGDAVPGAIRDHRPDIVLQDVNMPGADGLVVLDQALRWPDAPLFVMLTMHKDVALAQRALALGARGYVVKDHAEDELAACLAAVRSGAVYVSPALGEVQGRNDQAPAIDNRLDTLTPAERRVLELIATYKTSREIGELLHISHRTVQNHRANMAAKLDIHGPNALLQFALDHVANPNK